MLKDENKILAREVTPPSVYFNRRNFIRAGTLAASAVATGVVYRKLNPVGTNSGPSVQTEQRIGQPGRRPTLMFNGYEAQVGHLYAGMDLRKNF